MKDWDNFKSVLGFKTKDKRQRKPKKPKERNKRLLLLSLAGFLIFFILVLPARMQGFIEGINNFGKDFGITAKAGQQAWSLFKNAPVEATTDEPSPTPSDGNENHE